MALVLVCFAFYEISNINQRASLVANVLLLDELDKQSQQDKTEQKQRQDWYFALDQFCQKMKGTLEWDEVNEYCPPNIKDA